MPLFSPTTLARTALILGLLATGGASVALGQTGLTAAGFDTCHQDNVERIDKNHGKLKGAVACKRGDSEVFADELEYWMDTRLVVLTGSVTLRDKSAQISADSAEFNTETKLGTFHNASGFAMVAEKATHNQMGGQEPDVYFYGDLIEKIGEDTYRITRGGFTTCVQPTPRWQITSGSTTLRVDHYAFLKNALVKAKGVPVFYLPAIFYPIQKDDRATGFLMPTYGTSSYKGRTFSEAFFWAINRSQDATFLYDYYSKRGQGAGVEYRSAAPGSTGFLSVYGLAERATTTQSTDGSQTVTPPTQSYQVRGNLSQALGRRWSARGRVDYFTDIKTQQAYNTNIFDSSRSTRMYGGSISGSVAGLSVNGNYDHTEYFSGATDRTLTGNAPRVTVNRNESPLFGTPIYFSMGGEYASLLRQTQVAGVVSDRGLTRLDVMPTIRMPFTKLQFLTVNTSVAWRGTYWTRSQLPGDSSVVVNQPISRSYFDAQARVTGPVFSRVWATPNNGYAEKWKHSVEPYFTVERVTMVNNFDQIVQLDATDYVLGGTTRVDYGIANRVLAKRKGGGGSSAREILGFSIGQTYYSDDRASQYDPNYSTSFSGSAPTKLSPIRLVLRAAPTGEVNGTFRMEYDANQGLVQSMVADGQVRLAEGLRVSAGFSQRRLTSILDIVPKLDNYVQATATYRSPSNRIGGTYSFNYDLGRNTLLTSRIIGSYNVQCCGFAVEYQTYNFPQGTAGFPVAKDRRFNFSFTLSGLGTFSNFFGAMGGSGLQ